MHIDGIELLLLICFNHISMLSYVFVFIGGGLGCVSRYFLSSVASWPVSTGSFPVKTFFVNLLGSLLIGFFAGLFSHVDVRPEVRNMLVAGFCGGFTTFSTFSREAYDLLAAGEALMAVSYALLSLVLGVLLVFAGYVAGTRLVG